jgi:glycosyltransferase involved in cell wall biosynthesis
MSVIVPVWNGEARIGQCIEALKNQTLRADLFEIIVIDNGSTDSTVSVVARHSDVILLQEPQPGSYAARNAGLTRARGEYVAFTDSDCTPQKDWLELMSVSSPDEWRSANRSERMTVHVSTTSAISRCAKKRVCEAVWPSPQTGSAERASSSSTAGSTPR